MTTKGNHKESDITIDTEKKPVCGIIMPISGIDGCGPEHWNEILIILKEVAEDAGFEPNLVSDSDDIGIIQKRIIQNIYNNDVVICDVSCKNPNVMFELGMRLAFDKATIIIKDDKTDYSFDTSVIEHLGYPRDLRFHKILDFKESLKKKLKATHKKSIEDPNYSTFLKNFGEYKIAHLQEKEIPTSEFILKSLVDLRNEIAQLKAVSLLKTTPKSYLRPVVDYKTKVMKQFYEQYLKDNNNSIGDIKNSEDEIFNFIYQQDLIRRTFEDEEEIRKYFDRFQWV